jgi:hypothetical protein
LNSPNRKLNDYYPTPAIATYVLHKFGNLPKTILEPASGTGHISKILDILGYNVSAADIVEYENSYYPLSHVGDYLESGPTNAEAMVTNPPYMKKLPEKFLVKALEQDKFKYVAMLCRSNFMESQSRYELFQKYPPTKVLLFSDRITHDCFDLYDIDNNFRGMVCYAWYLWDYRNIEPTNIKTELKFILAKSYKDELKEILKQ